MRWIGSFIARSTLPSRSGGLMSARFSAIVLPVTVRQSPCSRPASSSAFMTTGTPPTRSMSVMTYWPNGLTSARCGTFAPIRLKSSRVRSTSASCGDGQQVQHGVGRAAEGHDHGDRVLERLLGHDVAGGDAPAQQLDDGLAGAAGEPVAAPVGGRRGGAAGQRHADRLGDAGHRVGGVHPAAGALAGADGPLDGVDVRAAHPTCGAGADGLERVDDRDRLLGAVGQLGDARAGSSRRRGRRWRGRAGPRPSACRAATCRSRPAAPRRRAARPA